MIRFGRELCNDLDAASEREWLETNGIGGFASSTVAGVNTRRYHGLLTAALRPPVGRHVLLSKLEETIILDGRRFDLSTNWYLPLVIHPQGYRFLRGFRLDSSPDRVPRFSHHHARKRRAQPPGRSGNQHCLHRAVRWFAGSLLCT